ncbi:ring-cleaving dioxygenase [Halogeometricum sp. wsp3]|nr:ring-cleaving dioxygenase [Halogeometricum sp. wsp3]
MTEVTPTPGIHHVTCIASDPQQNMDFWVETLGLRLVKRSINQDDPSTYHFFFADAEGNPGTSMTFFPWEDHARGSVGSGRVSRTASEFPKGVSLTGRRLDDTASTTTTASSGSAMSSRSATGRLPVELVEVEIPDDDPTEPWTEFVPEDAAIRGFHSGTLWLADTDPSAETYRTWLDEAGFSAGYGRYAWRRADPLCRDRRRREDVDGYRHRVAAPVTGRFTTSRSAPTDEDQQSMREAVTRCGATSHDRTTGSASESVYFRESGGVLFELATSGPGYDRDEPLDDLGGRLVLPGKFEGRREESKRGSRT